MGDTEYQTTYIQNVLNVCSQPCNFSPKCVQSCCHTFFSFSWFSHFWCPVCQPNVLFCNYKKVFAFWMLQLFSPSTGALWGSLVKMPQSNNWPLYQFLYMWLPSGLLDFVFYLIPTFLLRSDRPMKKPILEVGFQSSCIIID